MVERLGSLAAEEGITRDRSLLSTKSCTVLVGCFRSVERHSEQYRSFDLYHHRQPGVPFYTSGHQSNATFSDRRHEVSIVYSSILYYI